MSAIAPLPLMRALNVRFSCPAGLLIRQAEPLHITRRGLLLVRMLDNGERRLIDSSSLIQPAELAAAQAEVDDWAPHTQPSVYAHEMPACRGTCLQGQQRCEHPAHCATATTRNADLDDDQDDDDLPTFTGSLDVAPARRAPARRRAWLPHAAADYALAIALGIVLGQLLPAWTL